MKIGINYTFNSNSLSLFSCFSNVSECCKCPRMRFHCANSLVVLRICAPSEGALVAKMRLSRQQCFSHSINQGWANVFTGRVICRKPKHQRAAKPVCSVNTYVKEYKFYIKCCTVILSIMFLIF